MKDNFKESPERQTGTLTHHSSLDSTDERLSNNEQDPLWSSEDFRSRLRNLYPFVEESLSPLPKSWNPRDKCCLLALTHGDLRVHYKGPGKSHKDAAAVRTDFPIPVSCGLYYFEIRIISKGRDGLFGIGLSQAGVGLNRLPGWDKFSFGYHGDDGHSFAFSGSGLQYGPTFTTGDVVGCGLNLVDNYCFFTKNGHNIGIAYPDLPSQLYPTVGLQTPGEIVEANFGQFPFVFDIEEEFKSARLQLKGIISSFYLPMNKSECFNTLVSSYLVHHGYSATAESFILATGQSIPEDLESIERREQISRLVMVGHISEAIALIQQYYPGLLDRNKNLLFMLKCRQFVEMVAGNDGANNNAIIRNLDNFASKTLAASCSNTSSSSLPQTTANDLTPRTISSSGHMQQISANISNGSRHHSHSHSHASGGHNRRTMNQLTKKHVSSSGCLSSTSQRFSLSPRDSPRNSPRSTFASNVPPFNNATTSSAIRKTPPRSSHSPSTTVPAQSQKASSSLLGVDCDQLMLIDEDVSVSTMIGDVRESNGCDKDAYHSVGIFDNGHSKNGCTARVLEKDGVSKFEHGNDPVQHHSSTVCRLSTTDGVVLQDGLFPEQFSNGTVTGLDHDRPSNKNNLIDETAPVIDVKFYNDIPSNDIFNAPMIFDDKNVSTNGVCLCDDDTVMDTSEPFDDTNRGPLTSNMALSMNANIALVHFGRELHQLGRQIFPVDDNIDESLVDGGSSSSSSSSLDGVVDFSYKHRSSGITASLARKLPIRSATCNGGLATTSGGGSVAVTNGCSAVATHNYSASSKGSTQLSTSQCSIVGRQCDQLKIMQDAFSLMAYSDPWTSPLKDQLMPEKREPIAQAVNSSILELLGFPTKPSLEIVVAHLHSLRREMIKAGIAAAALIDPSLFTLP